MIYLVGTFPLREMMQADRTASKKECPVFPYIEKDTTRRRRRRRTRRRRKSEREEKRV